MDGRMPLWTKSATQLLVSVERKWAGNWYAMWHKISVAQRCCYNVDWRLERGKIDMVCQYACTVNWA
ncbi:MAG: hypothetical protein LBS09_04860 [Bacteroidales bacterium]|nr:hypothetical protein [Bacteroidales bacterium]